jgi:hypothetical protein
MVVSVSSAVMGVEVPAESYIQPKL